MDFLRGILYMAALGVASHILGQALPRRWFVWSRFPFRAYRWERNGRVYDVLKIRSWKTKMPDMSRILKYMVPKKVNSDCSAEDLDILVRETCVAEMVHILLCLIAPTIYHFCKNTVGIVLSVVYGVSNIPFILIQRYNRPKLVLLYQRMLRREAGKSDAYSDSVS